MRSMVYKSISIVLMIAVGMMKQHTMRKRVMTLLH